MNEPTPLAHERSLLAYALRYAQLLGWPVLPLYPRTKKPHGQLVPNGFKDASTDPEVIRGWWAACPDAGIGIALAAAGLVAVDIDPRNGGMLTIEALEAEHGPLVSDVLAYTGGGGEHRVFASQLVQALPGKLGPGVDLKADGYIAVEPTMHPSGKAYMWEAESDPLQGAVPSTLPGWIRDLARVPLAPLPAPEAPPIDPLRLASLREALPHIAADGRDAWLQVGMAIHNELPTHEGYAIWCDWSRTSAKFDAQDQLRVWRSFHRRGLSGTTLNTVFAMAQAAGWRNQGNVALLPGLAVPLSTLMNLRELDLHAAQIVWQVKHLVPMPSLGMIFGASGTFKSFIALDYCLHLAHGMDWLGRRSRPGKVVYVAAEGGSGIMQRIKAWHVLNRLEWRDVADLFFVLPTGVLLDQPQQISWLRRTIEERVGQPTAIMVDTLSQTFTGNENAADEISAFLRSCAEHLRDAFGAAVWIVHHSGHAATERPRGSSAISSNVDFMFGVFREDKDFVANLEFLKVKDGDLPRPVQFALTRIDLGTDDDGDPVTSLAAKQIRNVEQVLQAAHAKQESQYALIVDLLSRCVFEDELREQFMAQLPEDMKPDARRQAYARQKRRLTESGFARFGSGRVSLVDNSFQASE